jgi:hypothetical protein
MWTQSLQVLTKRLLKTWTGSTPLSAGVPEKAAAVYQDGIL